jgi:hypothetical protein
MQTLLRSSVVPMKPSVGGLSAIVLNTLWPVARDQRTRFLRFLRKLRSQFWPRRRFGSRESLARLANDHGVSMKIAAHLVRVIVSLLATATLRETAAHPTVVIVAPRVVPNVDHTQTAIPVRRKIVALGRGSASPMASGHLASRLLEIVLRARDLAKMDVLAHLANRR